MVSYILTAKATSTIEHELPSTSSTNPLKPYILLTGQLFHIRQDINRNNVKLHYWMIFFNNRTLLSSTKQTFANYSPNYDTEYSVL